MQNSGRALTVAALIAAAVLWFGLRPTTSRRPQSEVSVSKPSPLHVKPVASEIVQPGVPAAPASAAVNEVETLKSILKSKNDNDPRLDRMFHHMSPALKDQLIRYYYTLSPDELNSKGTLVFLLGRDLSQPSDADFLISVLQEPFSIAGRGDHELSDVTLAYPQIVAMRMLLKATSKIKDSPQVVALREPLQKLSRSGSPMIAQSALEVLAKLDSAQ